MRNIFTLLFLLTVTFVSAQTVDELRTKKATIESSLAPIKSEVDKLQAEIDALNGQIANFPGWYKGSFGTLGANFIGRNNWFAAGPELLNANTSNIMGSLNGFVNQIADKYFWRNGGSINLGWQRQRVNKDDKSGFKSVADVVNVNSLFGYKINSKLAASALGDFRTSIIENALNPGYLDIGAGVTYTPIKNMLFVFHPLNYNFIFAKDATAFTPSLGCKVVGDYNTNITKGLKWRTNLSGFLSYKSQTPSLHNGTWTNWFGFNLWKGIGVGIEHGLRKSAQESDKIALKPDFQQYYVVGLSYSL
jgi:Protein of unknown function (DUF3078)